MVDTKVSALPSAAPVLTDEVYVVTYPGGVPTSGRAALTALGTTLSAAAETLTNKTIVSPKISHNVQIAAADYTLVLRDQSGIVIMESAGSNTLTIPDNDVAAFPVGTKIEVWSTGAGTTTISGAIGVTLQGNGGSAAKGSCDIQTQYGGATLTKIATDTWLVGGDINTVT